MIKESPTSSDFLSIWM